jgi:hypothetical protein
MQKSFSELLIDKIEEPNRAEITNPEILAAIERLKQKHPDLVVSISTDGKGKKQKILVTFLNKSILKAANTAIDVSNGVEYTYTFDVQGEMVEFDNVDVRLAATTKRLGPEAKKKAH